MKSKKRNYRRNKKRKTKRNETKGGKVIGKGSDGFILHPSYDCGYTNKLDMYVSKAFIDKKAANIEFKAKTVIDDYPDMQKYFVLPIVQCDINKNKLSKDDKNELSKEFRNIPDNISMIIYPKGEKSAYDYLQQSPRSLDSIKLFLSLYTNVAYAINAMQFNDIVHLDFKLDNVLFIDNTFKIADITYLSKIQNIDSHSQYLEISRYYPVPSIYGFTNLFSNPTLYNGISDPKLISRINAKLTTHNPLLNLHKPYAESLFNKYISLFKENTLQHDLAKILKSYHLNMDVNTTIQHLSTLLHEKYKNQLLRFKTYLFLTIDTYSFGISLMQVAVHYFTDSETSNSVLLKKLHSIIYKCCEFSVEIKNFDEIFQMYIDMIKIINNT